MKLNFRKINVVLIGVSLLLSIVWIANVLPAAKADMPSGVRDELNPNYNLQDYACEPVVDEWQACKQEYEENGVTYRFHYEQIFGPTTICANGGYYDDDAERYIDKCCEYKCFAHLCVYETYNPFTTYNVWSGYAAGLQQGYTGYICEGPSTDGSARFCVTPTPEASTPTPTFGVTPTTASTATPPGHGEDL